LKIEVSTWGEEKKGDQSKSAACQIFERYRDSQEGEQHCVRWSEGIKEIRNEMKLRSKKKKKKSDC
jgi:hypothetical protein